jgi:GT2 family glycosyltransferase
MSPSLSIIIPTHNRREQLRRGLEALARQTIDLQEFEVVVVADGCTDGTLEMLGDYRPGYALQAVSLPGQGPAAARNAGAAAARGTLLVFLDDDIVAEAGFVAAHLQAQRDSGEKVVIGYLPPVLTTQSGFFRTALHNWWETMFDRMRRPGHRFSYRDLLSGNFSLPAGLFARLGGFNTDLRCHEDYEFGMRLVQSGVLFFFAPQALGYHHEKTNISRSLRRKFEEGEADVVLGRLHPELRPSLLMATLLEDFPLPVQMIGFLAFRLPVVGTPLMHLVQLGLPVLEWFRLRPFWRYTLDGLMAYWYWRGVARHFKSLGEVQGFLVEPGPPRQAPDIDLDLAQGLTAAEQLLDRERPASAAVRYGRHLVGWIPALPGAERLRGAHLRRILAVDLLPAFRRALAQAGIKAIFGSE